MDPIPFLLGQWAVISQALPTYFATAAVIMLAVYFFVRHQYGERIDSLDGRLKLRDDEIADYKRKLEGASPEEAREKMQRLEQRIEDLSPRRLGPQAKTAMKTVLMETRSSIEILQDLAAGNIRQFVGDLSSVFRDSDWYVVPTSGLGLSRVPAEGVGLAVHDRASLTEEERIIARALELAGVKFEIMTGEPKPGPHAPQNKLIISARLD